METNEYIAGSAAMDYGGLETIDDIDPATAEALARIGIQRVADLSGYTPRSLAKVLREQAGLSISAKRIETKNWIGQAQARIQPADAPTPAPATGAETPAPWSPAPEWRQRAAFTVFFDYQPAGYSAEVWQTRIYHEESGDETLFPGTDPTPWVGWMMERLHPSNAAAATPSPAPADAAPVAVASPEPPAAPSTIPGPELPDTPSAATLTPEPPAAPPATPGPQPLEAAFSPTPPAIMPVEVLSLDLVEIHASNGSGAEKLAAEVRFRLTDSAIVIASSITAMYQVDIRLRDLDSGAAPQVATQSGPFQRATVEYSTQVLFPVPSPGHYELESIILLHSAGQVQAHYQGQGPRFRVVP